MADVSKGEVHVLNAAVGWLELGMPQEALLELDQLSVEAQGLPDVLEVRWLILADLKSWDRAVEVSARLVQVAGDRASSWLHHAYATRRAVGGGLLKAFDVLAPIASQFPSETLIPYNLACYTCQLHRSDSETIAWLSRALAAGSSAKVLEMALNDTDLLPVRGLVQKLAEIEARSSTKSKTKA